MTRKILLTTVLAALLGGSAGAQSTGQRIVIERTGQISRQEGTVRVQLSMQLFISGPTDDSPEAEQGRARARRLIYDLGAKECELLRSAIAKDCRLQSINVNFHRQQNQTLHGYSVNGSMSFQITLK